MLLYLLLLLFLTMRALSNVWFKTPSITWFSFINLRCVCACKKCIISIKVTIDRSFSFSKKAINVSYLSSTVTIFSTSLESGNSFPNNFILFTLSNTLFEYFFNCLRLFHSLHLELPYQIQNFYASNLFVPFIFCFQVFEISFWDFRVMILVRIICETPTNEHNFALAFLVFFFLLVHLDLCHGWIFRQENIIFLYNFP